MTRKSHFSTKSLNTYELDLSYKLAQPLQIILNKEEI